MAGRGENYFRYIPVRRRDVQWGLYVTGAGCTRVRPGSEYPARAHPELYRFRWTTGRTLPEYQVIYITEGEGVFESPQTGLRDIGPGTVLLLFPGVWHRYRPSETIGWSEHWVGFLGDVMDRLVQQRFFGPDHAVIHTGLHDTIRTPYDTLLERLRGEATGFPHLIAADTLAILAAVSAFDTREPAELISRGPQDVMALKDRTVAEAMRLIWDQSQGPMTVASLARQLPITRRSLERRFQTAVGHGIHEEIVRCRLERARRLLVATDLSLKEIAAAAGFSGADGMGRTFRRWEGLTPLEYRQRRGG